jgi:geranylgeranyl pyrophosphate synthase
LIFSKTQKNKTGIYISVAAAAAAAAATAQRQTLTSITLDMLYHAIFMGLGIMQGSS